MDRELAFARIRVRDNILNCTRCELRDECDTPVPYRGPTPARLAVVGEGPAREETKEGQPFVGPAGRVLEEVLLEAEIDPTTIFYMNATNCWASKTKNPTPDQIAACRPHFLAQLNLARPQFVILAGGKALSTVMPNGKITQEHGKPFWHHFPYQEQGVCVMPIYHPAYYLRSGNKLVREHIVADLQLLVAMMRLDDAFGAADGWTSVCTNCKGAVTWFDEIGRGWCDKCMSGDMKVERDKRLAEIAAMK